MSELSPDDPNIDAVVQAVSSLWERQDSDVPDWAAQELTFGQMRLLFLLSKHGPSPMSHIAEWLGVGLPKGTWDTPGGFLEEGERPLDGLRRELLEEIAGMQRDVLRRTLGVLTGDELRELARLISIVVERSR